MRIIAGQWRGRSLPVADLPTLRPTTDRIRETLFNWLQSDVPGARCLDLFAGTGSLGLEALSRGASYCDFVEHQAPAQQALRSSLETLGAKEHATVYAGDAWQFLGHATAPYDLIFVDPPFDKPIIESVCETLEDRALITPETLVYIEQAAQSASQVPSGWETVREKRGGGVVYGLYCAI
ncbi:MAG: 16S rRNA (guanine(966)-N(2))-methyltransferase RsmD [Congregibacter sp.]